MMRFIVAIDEKRGLADETGIPWTIPTDQQFFVDETREGTILMGYGTYLEFETPMHARINYVATQQNSLKPSFIPVHDAAAFITQHSNEVINNIGGAGLFTSTLDRADELLITQLEGDFNCTKFFPEFTQDFALTYESEPITENAITYRFQTWKRQRNR